MKFFYLSAAFLCLLIGAVGVVVPVLPTTPFLLLSSLLFAKGSAKFHAWFMETKLYKSHVHDFMESRSMTLKAKLSILIPVSALLILSIIIVPYLHVRILIAAIMVFKYYFFIFKIKTIKE